MGKREPKRLVDMRKVKFPLSEKAQQDLLVKLDEEMRALAVRRDAEQEAGQPGRAWQYNALMGDSQVDALRVAFNDNLWAALEQQNQMLREMHELLECIHAHVAEARRVRRRKACHG